MGYVSGTESNKFDAPPESDVTIFLTPPTAFPQPDGRGKDELVAELCSMLANTAVGVPVVCAGSRRYMHTWAKLILEDRHLFRRAAAVASHIFDDIVRFFLEYE